MNEVILKYRPRTMWGLSDIANTLDIDRQIELYKGDITWWLLKWISKGKTTMPSATEFYNQFTESGVNGSDLSGEEIIDNLIAKYKQAE